MTDLVLTFNEPKDKSADDGVSDKQDGQSDRRDQKRDETLEAADTATSSTESLLALLLRLQRRGGADDRLPSRPPSLPPHGLRRCDIELQRGSRARFTDLSDL